MKKAIAILALATAFWWWQHEPAKPAPKPVAANYHSTGREQQTLADASHNRR